MSREEFIVDVVEGMMYGEMYKYRKGREVTKDSLEDLKIRVREYEYMLQKLTEKVAALESVVGTHDRVIRDMLTPQPHNPTTPQPHNPLIP